MLNRWTAAAMLAAGALIGLVNAAPASAAEVLPVPTGATTAPAATLNGTSVGCGQDQPYGYIGLTVDGVTFSATVTGTSADPTASAEVQLWPVSSPDTVTDVTTATVASGSTASTRIPESAFADGVTYAWRVRAVSGSDTSAWTTECHFIRDLLPPPAPTVTSATFPPAGSGSTPVRTYGTFTFSVPTPTRVAGFEYVLNGTLAVAGNPSAPIGADGTATTPPLASGLWGTNILTVESVDVAGNVSQSVNYTFNLTPATKADKYGDLNGDGVPDLLSVGSDGYLYYAQGRADGGVAAPVRLSTAAPDGAANGWAGAMVSTGGDFTQDGYQDLIAVQNGAMYIYTGTGLGGFSNGPEFVEPPSGQSDWSAVTQVVAAGDLTGSGRSDLLVKEGDQLYYVAGGFGPFFDDPVAVAGTGWSGMTVVGVADVTGDGVPDVIARDDASGAIWAYPGAGDGTFGDATTRTRIGSGLSAAAFPLVETKGDANGDGTTDIRAVGADGHLYLIPGRASGGFGCPVRIGAARLWRHAVALT